MFATIINGQIDHLTDSQVAGEDSRPVVDGVKPPQTTGTIIPIAMDRWQIEPTQVVRGFEEVFVAPAMAAANALAEKRQRILDTLFAALAGESDPDFSGIGVVNFPLALRSQVLAGLATRALAPLATIVVPTTGQTQTFTTTRAWHVIACDHAATIAAQTFVFPSDANSVIGQELRIFSRSIITTVTLTTTGLTIRGAALTTLPANGSAAWRKVAASTWVRIQ